MKASKECRTEPLEKDSNFWPGKNGLEEEFDVPGADKETLRKAYFEPVEIKGRLQQG